jgi:integrase/recombinase XerD
MPIANYEQAAITEKRKLLTNPKISEKNKENLKRFFDTYNVKPATMAKFCRHISEFVETFEDVEELMDEYLISESKENNSIKREARDKVNKFFASIREKNYSPSTIATCINVINRFAKWLNDDEKPYSFKDIKNFKKDKQKRDLSREDMFTPEDRDKLVEHASTNQFKAIIASQLEGGFRPSEFVDLKYGDIHATDADGIVRVKVQEGKTGSRDVCLYYAAPYLLQWLEEHPTKKKEDYLWITEHPKQSKKKGNHNINYTNAGIVKRIKRLCQTLEINKPTDLYNLRHSACFISKLENMSPEFAANNFGHTIHYYDQVYGRLAGTDRVKQLSRHVSKMKEEEEKHIVCPICKHINPPKTEYCKRCTRPVSLKLALEANERMKQMEEQLNEVQKFIKVLEDNKLMTKIGAELQVQGTTGHDLNKKGNKVNYKDVVSHDEYRKELVRKHFEDYEEIN